MPLNIPHSDAIWIAGSLYCKTPDALSVALDTLRGIGYAVKDQRTEGYSIREGRTTPEQMEQEGWSLWFAHLEDIHYGKCSSCGSYISRQGVRTHGHQCEVCGAVTYYDLAEGSTIKFTFRGEERGWFSPSLRMTVKRWDTGEGWLYLLHDFEPGSFSVMGPQEAEAYLAEHYLQWEAVEEDGQRLIKLRYHLHHMGEPISDETVIDPTEIWGHRFNYTEVRLWNGTEYGEHDFGGKALPVPESIAIYEAWHWAPLEPSPTLHQRIITAVGQVPDAGYYYQDGRPAWSRRTYEEMGIFVRHLTTLDADAWDWQSLTFRLDGPGGIADVAAFCHPDAVVENRPNIGNFLVGAAKIMSGEPLTVRDLAAMEAALENDPDTQGIAKAIIREGFRRPLK